MLYYKRGILERDLEIKKGSNEEDDYILFIALSKNLLTTLSGISPGPYTPDGLHII